MAEIKRPAPLLKPHLWLPVSLHNPAQWCQHLRRDADTTAYDRQKERISGDLQGSFYQGRRPAVGHLSNEWFPFRLWRYPMSAHMTYSPMCPCPNSLSTRYVTYKHVPLICRTSLNDEAIHSKLRSIGHFSWFVMNDTGICLQGCHKSWVYGIMVYHLFYKK